MRAIRKFPRSLGPAIDAHASELTDLTYPSPTVRITGWNHQRVQPTVAMNPYPPWTMSLIYSSTRVRT